VKEEVLHAGNYFEFHHITAGLTAFRADNQNEKVYI
jgi:hypothetical protein